VDARESGPAVPPKILGASTRTCRRGVGWGRRRAGPRTRGARVSGGHPFYTRAATATTTTTESHASGLAPGFFF